MTAEQRPIVLLANAVHPDKFGGLERYVRELGHALSTSGRDVTLIGKRVSEDTPEEEIADDGVRIVRYRVPSKRDPSFGLRYPAVVVAAVRRELRRRRGAIVHGHFSVPCLPLALQSANFLFTFHAPVYKELISERQGSYLLPRSVQGAAVAALRAAERRVVTKASALVVLSEFMRDELALLAPGAAERALLVPGGIDTDRFKPAPFRVPSDGLASANPLLVVVRRLTPRTGVQQLVEAMTHIRSALPGVRLAVLSDGPQRAAIEAAVADRGLAEVVTFVGRVSDDDLVDWYRRADLVIVPTQELEGFGLTTAEAMACGTPVMVTPVGANPEVAGRLDPGLVSSGATSEQMATAVVRIVGDQGLLADVRGRARSVVDPALSWDAVVDQHLELYERQAG